MRNQAMFFAFAVALLAGQTQAGVAIQPGSTVYLNFDLTGSTPPPPYGAVIYGGDFGYGLSLPTGMAAAFFGGADGTGGLIQSIAIFTPFDCSQGTSCFITSGTNAAELLDGLFSIGFFAASGSGTWDIGASGCAKVNPNDTQCTRTDPFAGIASTAVTAGDATVATVVTVPEPITLGLLGVGLAGIAVARRKVVRR